MSSGANQRQLTAAAADIINRTLWFFFPVAREKLFILFEKFELIYTIYVNGLCIAVTREREISLSSRGQLLVCNKSFHRVDTDRIRLLFKGGGKVESFGCVLPIFWFPGRSCVLKRCRLLLWRRRSVLVIFEFTSERSQKKKNQRHQGPRNLHKSLDDFRASSRLCLQLQF